ncbi:hypothetical protein Aph01nite_43250 [Acrocarpospora phusangensis]|uniref:Uncharacterized protein n=1 Tax=Acrocarpospora phusangensis TaxID=1070424 RepID=A0A919US12_9ACTN|nr:hypothetical protein [Acrocarpospora phusangensis]GIH26015.1 hypothetical protein Aph01nite_43250 [Acrocarpospora phusangensis]
MGSRTLAEMAERFAKETAEHELTILHNDGIYRHLRCKNPRHGMYWFDLVTWPGSLAIRGDVDGYIFTRTTDMFEFFRSDGARVNPHYWSEKTEGGRRACRSYSEDYAKARVLGEIRDLEERPPGLFLALQRDLFDHLHFEDEAHEALERFDYQGVRFYDVWEWDLHDYDWSFLWACHAIVWGIAQYDASKAAAGAEREAVTSHA